MPCDFSTAQGQRRRLDESKLKPTRKGGVDLPIHSKSRCLDRVIRNVSLAMPTAPHVSRTANFLGRLVIRCNSIKLAAFIVVHLYFQGSYPPSFTEAFRKNGALQSLIQPFGELLKGHQIWSRKDITSNDLGKPSKHVTRFPLRGLVLEFQRPGRGQSNASELTIARSDQLRGCCKKGTISSQR